MFSAYAIGLMANTCQKRVAGRKKRQTYLVPISCEGAAFAAPLFKAGVSLSSVRSQTLSSSELVYPIYIEGTSERIIVTAVIASIVSAAGRLKRQGRIPVE